MAYRAEACRGLGRHAAPCCAIACRAVLHRAVPCHADVSAGKCRPPMVAKNYKKRPSVAAMEIGRQNRRSPAEVQKDPNTCPTSLISDKRACKKLRRGHTCAHATPHTYTRMRTHTHQCMRTTACTDAPACVHTHRAHTAQHCHNYVAFSTKAI